MVGNPVEDDPHAASVGIVDEGAEVVFRTKRRLYGAEIANAIGRTYTTNPSARVDGHQPQHIYPHLLQNGQICLDGIKCLLLGKEALVALIDNRGVRLNGIDGIRSRGWFIGFLSRAASCQQHQ